MALSQQAKTWIIIGSIILIIFMLGSCYVGKRNNMIKKQELVKNKWAQVENQLKRRYDLIPNLVNTVKGYAKHEKELFTQIAESRAKLAGAATQSDKVKAANGMERALGRLLVIVERYPVLQASANFRSLQDELAGTENRIAVERKRYNDAVTDFNTYIKIFPNNIIAGGAFKEAELFEIPEASKAVPKVEFD